MSDQIIYLNGEYKAIEDACVPVLDRGFIFGDGVYEVIPAYHRQLFRIDSHMQRLQNSLDAIRIKNPLTAEEWKTIFNTIIEKNTPQNQSIYLQVTRGIAKRDHAFPQDATPTVFVMSSALTTTDIESFNKGVSAVTLDDIRWQYCHIKAIALLPNILLRQQAIDKGAAEAILIRDNKVSEGSASNIFMVKDATVYTPPKGQNLLPGITRDLIVELCDQHGINCKQESFSPAQLLAADEVWLSSSTKEILPIIEIDGNKIADGKPGEISRRLFSLFQDYKASLKPV